MKNIQTPPDYWDSWTKDIEKSLQTHREILQNIIKRLERLEMSL